MTLTEFLLARIAEDEAACHRYEAEVRADLGSFDEGLFSSVGVDHTREMGYPYMSVDSSRILAECEAKRGIIERVAFMVDEPDGLGTLCEGVLLQLAQVHADHSDFDVSWRP